MSVTHKDLTWFRLANSNAPSGFYPFKARFLAKYAERDGWDLQTIDKHCYTCEGSGRFSAEQECFRCDGSGIYRTDEHWLQRWILCGQLYHVPEFCSPPHYLRGDSPKHEYHGLIKHEPVTSGAANRAFMRLLLRHEPGNFWLRVVARIQDAPKQFRTRWWFRLVRLRNKLDLFPAIDTNKDVPF